MANRIFSLKKEFTYAQRSLTRRTGPIYLGKNSIVQEGAIIRGAFALGEEGHVNMGAKIRGDVTVGPYCKVGGEVSNSVLLSYSNKAHDGYLGQFSDR